MPSYLTFPVVNGLSFATSKTIKPKVRTVEFGDGYTQESPDGINYIRRSWDLRWENITDEEKSSIDDFLTARGGYQTFLWAEYLTDITYKVKCREWGVKPEAPSLWSMTGTFNQVFI